MEWNDPRIIQFSDRLHPVGCDCCAVAWQLIEQITAVAGQDASASKSEHANPDNWEERFDEWASNNKAGDSQGQYITIEDFRLKDFISNLLSELINEIPGSAEAINIKGYPGATVVMPLRELKQQLKDKYGIK